MSSRGKRKQGTDKTSADLRPQKPGEAVKGWDQQRFQRKFTDFEATLAASPEEKREEARMAWWRSMSRGAQAFMFLVIASPGIAQGDLNVALTVAQGVADHGSKHPVIVAFELLMLRECSPEEREAAVPDQMVREHLAGFLNHVGGVNMRSLMELGDKMRQLAHNGGVPSNEDIARLLLEWDFEDLSPAMLMLMAGINVASEASHDAVAG